ncbi:helix-turn-helix domain-containing protein [Photobacterium aphoticum]|uniref:Cupin n=1 Tax=Photobacterium aphoticum TaxID=754436 RepID=A0A0J1GRK8_9GAMM|nr:AraC family transcriptional regulator [Photobacterium aphoticum]KLV02306.1 cupin [Photobacterium aphoticum]PSU56286.1 AraC family transcriptional regulator [Photobacterium aphoticum]GHA55452.1 putative HTH-type transcriptional regulator YdeC [Photobacterium aphoticum]
MQIYHIQTAPDGKELTPHGSEDFPFAFYDERFSEFVTGEVPWHWHDEIEIVWVVEGSTQVECLGSCDILQPGQIIFINAGVLHKLSNVGDTDCRILNVVFDPRLIGGTPLSRIYTQYVAPVINNSELLCYVFSPQTAWQQQAILALQAMFTVCQQVHAPASAAGVAPSGYELAVNQHLLAFWQTFCVHAPTIMARRRVSSTQERRLQTALHFIHQHYADKLSIAAISQAASISETECYRLFRQTLKCSPNQYVLQYRLQQSTVLLTETRQPITDIAYEVGFNCPAYFAKKFRLAFGKTPKQCRQESQA